MSSCKLATRQNSRRTGRTQFVQHLENFSSLFIWPIRQRSGECRTIMTKPSITLTKIRTPHPLVRWAVGGWTLFVVENAVLSENRTWLIDLMGDENYHTFYGTFSTIATVSIGYAYFKITRKLPPMPSRLKRWKSSASPPVSAGIGSWICMSTGLVMASQVAPTFQIPVSFTENSAGSLQMNVQVRCPFDFNDKRLESSDPFSARGLERISRHPGLWSFGLMGMSQSFLAPTIPLQVWWL